MSPIQRLFACTFVLLFSGLSSAQSQAQDVLFLPVFGSQPETGFQFGLAGVWEQSAEPDAWAVNVFSLASVEQQYRANLTVRTPGLLARRPDYFEFAGLLRDFPDDFYGYQAQLMRTGLRFSEQTLGLDMVWWVPLDRTWSVGTGVRLLTSSVRFDEPNDPLLNGVAWRAGGRLWGLNAALQRDTRDDPDWPTRGSLLSVSSEALQSGQERSLLLAAMLSQYQSLRPGLILATAVQVQAASANTPFLLMPELSDTLRGLSTGQFRHQATVSVQGELRAVLSPRWSVVGLTHLGQVGADPVAWADTPWKWGYGAGLRFSVSRDRRLNLRLDYGVVDGRGGVVIQFGEAF